MTPERAQRSFWNFDDSKEETPFFSHNHLCATLAPCVPACCQFFTSGSLCKVIMIFFEGLEGALCRRLGIPTLTSRTPAVTCPRQPPLTSTSPDHALACNALQCPPLSAHDGP
jgi:hypothetical protein